jgi:hypothetical protein
VLQVKTRIPADGEMPLDVPSTGTTSGQLKLIMKTGLLPDALDPGFHCVRTHWIQGFMAFQLARRTRSVMLTVPVWPEFVYGTVPPGCGR